MSAPYFILCSGSSILVLATAEGLLYLTFTENSQLFLEKSRHEGSVRGSYHTIHGPSETTSGQNGKLAQGKGRSVILRTTNQLRQASYRSRKADKVQCETL